MEEEKSIQSEVERFHVTQLPKINTFDLSKKRKLQADQWGLPTSKHTCWGRSFLSERICVLQGDSSSGGEFSNLKDGLGVDDGAELESAEHNNSFVEESDSAMCLHEEAKVQPEHANSSDPDSASTVDYTCAARFKTARHSLETGTVMNANPATAFLSKGCCLHLCNNGLHAADDDVVGCSQCGNGGIEQFTERELEDLLYSNVMDPDMYVLSSGRILNQEDQSGTRKLTIDQEFEQYFSMLML